MPTTETAERYPATLEEIREILDKLTERQAEYDRRWEREIAMREVETARRRKEEAERRKEEAERRETEDKRREAEARREEDRAKWEAARRKEEMRRDAKREKEWDELRKKFDRTDRQFEKTKALIEANGVQIGGLNNSFGEIVEHLVGPGIIDRFRDLGYHFDDIKERTYEIPGKKPGQIKAEVDLLLENDDTIIAVEVKSRPETDKGKKKGDISHHIRRLEILRKYRESQGVPPKRILGAIAGAVFYDDVKQAVLDAGLFVLEQSGDTMRLDVPKDFKPREW